MRTENESTTNHQCMGQRAAISISALKTNSRSGCPALPPIPVNSAPILNCPCSGRQCRTQYVTNSSRGIRSFSPNSSPSRRQVRTSGPTPCGEQSTKCPICGSRFGRKTHTRFSTAVRASRRRSVALHRKSSSVRTPSSRGQWNDPLRSRHSLLYNSAAPEANRRSVRLGKLSRLCRLAPGERRCRKTRSKTNSTLY
jgi:hypothetical protein